MFRVLSKAFASTIIFTLTICIAVSVTASEKNNSNIKKKPTTEEALKIYNERIEAFILTEEQMKQEMIKYSPAKVLSAASLAKAFNKDIEYVYQILDKNNNMTDVLQILREKNNQNKAIKNEEPIKNSASTKELSQEEKVSLKNQFDEKSNSDTPVTTPIPSAKEKEMSNEEMMKLKKQTFGEEKQHEYVYMYLSSKLNSQKTSISHIYRKTCVFPTCTDRYSDITICKEILISSEYYKNLKDLKGLYVFDNSMNPQPNMPKLLSDLPKNIKYEKELSLDEIKEFIPLEVLVKQGYIK